MKYPDNTLNAVALHFSKGTDLREIERRLFVPIANLSRWKKEGFPSYFQPENSGSETLEQPNGTSGTIVETPEQDAGTAYDKQAENRILTPENAVSPVPIASEQPTQKPLVRGWDWLLIGVYFFTIGTGCLAMWNILGAWSVCLIAPYVLISLHSISMAIDPAITKTAERARGTVVALEFIASCLDVSLFNDLLWSNYKKLPVRIYEQAVNGEWGWANGWVPLAAACFIAACMFAAAFYAVDTMLEITKERSKNNQL